MDRLTCVPLYVSPEKCLTFSEWRVLPGVTLARLTGGLKNVIKEFDRKALSGKVPPFSATHAVCIDEEAYFEALADRLKAEGHDLPPKLLLEPHSIAKQVVLALLLIGQIQFKYQGSYAIEVYRNRGKRRFQLRGWGNHPERELQDGTRRFLPGVGKRDIGRPRLVRTVLQLDRYLRAGRWWTDRLSQALSFFWNGICTPHADQSFLSFTAALESLLNTQPMEITHTLAERAALLVGRDAQARLDVYRQVKDLYALRSKIIHGKAFPKKGKRVDAESLFISAKHSIVPCSQMRALAGLLISVLNRVLADHELLLIIQTKRNEDKTSKELDQLFLERLFQ